ncbi:MAG: c-type cytochrome domain-containing protein, partial [Phycisphaeraceae bacterium]
MKRPPAINVRLTGSARILTAIVMTLTAATGLAITWTAAARAEDAATVVEVGPEHAEEMAAGRKMFREQIRPVLLGSCIECHGQERVRADLDMATRASLMAGGQSGEVIIPGDAANSLFYQVLTHEREPHMPH